MTLTGVLRDLIAKASRTGLRPVKKLVRRRGRQFMQTFYVRPDNPEARADGFTPASYAETTAAWEEGAATAPPLPEPARRALRGYTLPRPHGGGDGMLLGIEPDDAGGRADPDEPPASYALVNAYLREPANVPHLTSDPAWRADVDAYIANLDAALRTQAAPSDALVYRGFRVAWPPALAHDALVGRVLHDPGFTSTTTQPDIARHYAGRAIREPGRWLPAFAEIEVPRGQAGAYLQPVSAAQGHDAEYEFLFPRGTHFLVTRARLHTHYWDDPHNLDDVEDSEIAFVELRLRPLPTAEAVAKAVTQPRLLGLVPEKKVVRRSDGSTFTQTFHVRPPEAKPARQPRLLPQPAPAPARARRDAPKREEPEREEPERPDPRQGKIDFDAAPATRATPTLDWPMPPAAQKPQERREREDADARTAPPTEPGVRADPARVRVGSESGNEATLTAGDRHPLLPGTREYRVPKASLEHHLDELHHRVRGQPDSGDEAVNEVVRGKARYLGRGNDGMVFRVGDEVVKVGIVTPYHADQRRMYRTPQEAVDRLREQVRISERMRQAGVPMVPETRFVEHDGRGYAVREYLDIPDDLTREELDEVQLAIIRMHDEGFVVRDEIQVGRTRDGRLAFFDVGSAAVGEGKGEGSGAYADGDFGNDLGRIEALYRKHGQPYEAIGGIGLKRDLDMIPAQVRFAQVVAEKHPEDTKYREGVVKDLQSVYRRAVADAKRRLTGPARAERITRVRRLVDASLKTLGLPEDTVAKAADHKGDLVSMEDARRIPTPPITIPHTPSQAKAFEDWWKRVMDREDAARNDIKRIEFKPGPGAGGIYVYAEVGMRNDEGKATWMFRRLGHLHIGPKGALRAHDGNTWVKGRDAYRTYRTYAGK